VAKGELRQRELALAKMETTMESAVRLRIWVLLVLTVGALVSSLGAAWHTGDWGGLALNLGTEMAGALVTYLLLELVIGRKEWREARRADLIAQLGSSVEGVAIAAAKELWRRGWLYDGSLRGAYLERANLEGVDLSRANLREAHLGGADLSKASLYGADLSGANLYKAHLRGADLSGADLREAHLEGADLCEAHLREAHLEEADLSGANLYKANLHRSALYRSALSGANLYRANLYKADLSGADLSEANLEGVRLRGANLSGARLPGANLEYTALPDGTSWTPDTDMARFTDPEHPDFWRPDV
jgi:uncharacterized protein YjbI with pentapeptide repeats